MVTRHGKPIVGLVSAADLERLEAGESEQEPEEIISTVSAFREVGGAVRPEAGG